MFLRPNSPVPIPRSVYWLYKYNCCIFFVIEISQIILVNLWHRQDLPALTLYRPSCFLSFTSRVALQISEEYHIFWNLLKPRKNIPYRARSKFSIILSSLRLVHILALAGESLIMTDLKYPSITIARLILLSPNSKGATVKRCKPKLFLEKMAATPSRVILVESRRDGERFSNRTRDPSQKFRAASSMPKHHGLRTLDSLGEEALARN